MGTQLVNSTHIYANQNCSVAQLSDFLKLQLNWVRIVIKKHLSFTLGILRSGKFTLTRRYDCFDSDARTLDFVERLVYLMKTVNRASVLRFSQFWNLVSSRDASMVQIYFKPCVIFAPILIMQCFDTECQLRNQYYFKATNMLESHAGVQKRHLLTAPTIFRLVKI